MRAVPVPFGMIILAGGRARRLGGTDKPGLVVGGRTLLAAVVSAGTEAGARRVVVVGPDRPGIADGGRAGGEGPAAVRFVGEEPPGSGPVPALRRGLTELGAPWPRDGAAEPWVAILAADLPFLRAAHLRALLAAASDGHDGAILVDEGERAQWLAGCWRATVLRRAAAGYEGASLHGLLGPLRPVRVHITAGPGEPPAWLDCDTEADVRRARGWLGAGQAPVPGASPGTTTLRSGSPATNRRIWSATNRAASG